ncbi:MAG: CsiV family protein [Pseudomonadota bacterium]
MKPPISALRLVALWLTLAGSAEAALRVDVLAFTQPAAAEDPLAWSTTLPLPPCHAVQLREGGGAEAAFRNESECVKKPGYDPVYAGYAGAGTASLATAAGKLKNGGHRLLLNRGWRQSGDLSPVLLSGGNTVANRPEVVGTLSVSVMEKYIEVTLELVVTRFRAEQPDARPEYLTIRETRKMKSGEPHYFDHPLVGAIVQVVDTEVEAKNRPALP